jgi:hypothetical protein
MGAIGTIAYGRRCGRFQIIMHMVYSGVGGAGARFRQRELTT